MDIHKLIAGLSPETYCQPATARQVRRLLRQNNTVSPPEAVLQAAVPAEPQPANLVPLERLEEMDLFDCPGLQSPRSQFTYTRDAMAESIEAFYFSILNHLEQLEGWQVFKLVDEFQSSLLSSPFADVAKQQSLIQRQAFEGLDAVQALTRDMLDTIQQLEAMQLAAAGQGSGADGTMSPDASSPALELRRAQLRSQLALLKLRAATLRPWLQQGELTSTHHSLSPFLVNAFNTATFQVLLLAVGPDVLPQAVQAAELPAWIPRKVHRSYRPVLVLELQCRTRPQKSRSHGYAYRGQTELTLTSYGLHQDEREALRQTLDLSLLRQSLRMGTGETSAALEDLVHRVEQLVHPSPTPTTASLPEDTNPFMALFSALQTAGRWLLGLPARENGPASPDLRPDAHLETVARSLAILQATRSATELHSRLKAAGH